MNFKLESVEEWRKEEEGEVVSEVGVDLKILMIQGNKISRNAKYFTAFVAFIVELSLSSRIHIVFKGRYAVLGRL